MTDPVYVQTLAASGHATLATAFIPRQIAAFASLLTIHEDLSRALSRQEMSHLKWRRTFRWTRSQRPVNF